MYTVTHQDGTEPSHSADVNSDSDKLLPGQAVGQQHKRRGEHQVQHQLQVLDPEHLCPIVRLQEGAETEPRPGHDSACGCRRSSSSREARRVLVKQRPVVDVTGVCRRWR